MIIKKINLYNFRNYKKTEIILQEGINVFWGSNGSGKTNILESIYYVAYTHSFRTLNDVALVNENSDKMFVEIESYHDGLTKLFSLEFSKEQRKKIAKINNNKLPKLSKIIGEIPIILFSPETIQIIKADPQLRRDFIDEFLYITDNSYYELLLKYQKIISHRNYILKKIKEGKQNSNSLEIWNEQMINFGTEVILKRVNMINEMNKIISSYFPEFFYKINLSYNSKHFNIFNKDEIIKTYKTLLGLLMKEEIVRGITLFGPHKDDIDIYYENKLAKLYASEGQHRIIALILKFVQAKLLKLKKDTEPVLLLDDFSSELDENNRKIIGDLLKNIHQILITTTSLNNIKNLSVKKSFFIENGILVEK